MSYPHHNCHHPEEAGHRPFGRRHHPARRHRGSGGGYGRGRGGRAGRGDLRNVILSLLAQSPMHGYQLINLIGERTNSQWTPSPGAIYPTLSLLEDEGLISITTGSGRKLATLTGAGEQLVAENNEQWSKILDSYAHPQDPQDPHFRVREGMFRLRQAVKSAAEADRERIIGILNRAAEEIEGR